ncbi:MAG: collagen binding domain-containing protein [Angelakisella sp.]
MQKRQRSELTLPMPMPSVSQIPASRKRSTEADGSWIITGVAAGTTRYSVTLPGDQVITGTVTVAEGAETAVEEPVTWKVDGHWIHQTIDYPNPYTLIDFKTDGTGTFILPDYLVYGDYLLYEIESPEGYVQAEPFAFTVNKSDANDSKIHLDAEYQAGGCAAESPDRLREVRRLAGWAPKCIRLCLP